MEPTQRLVPDSTSAANEVQDFVVLEALQLTQRWLTYLRIRWHFSATMRVTVYEAWSACNRNSRYQQKPNNRTVSNNRTLWGSWVLSKNCTLLLWVVLWFGSQE